MRLHLNLLLVAVALVAAQGCSSTRPQQSAPASTAPSLGSGTADTNPTNPATQYDRDPPPGPALAQEPPAVPPALGISSIRGISLTRLLGSRGKEAAEETKPAEDKVEASPVLFSRSKDECAETPGGCGERGCVPEPTACPCTQETQRYCDPKTSPKGCLVTVARWLRLRDLRCFGQSQCSSDGCGDTAGCGDATGCGDAVGCGDTGCTAVAPQVLNTEQIDAGAHPPVPEPENTNPSNGRGHQQPTDVPPIPTPAAATEQEQAGHRTVVEPLPQPQPRVQPKRTPAIQTMPEISIRPTAVNRPRAEPPRARRSVVSSTSSVSQAAPALSLESTGEQWVQPSQWSRLSEPGSAPDLPVIRSAVSRKRVLR